MEAKYDLLPFVHTVHDELKQPASSQQFTTKLSSTDHVSNKVCNSDADNYTQAPFSIVVGINTLGNSPNAVLTGMSLSAIVASTNK